MQLSRALNILMVLIFTSKAIAACARSSPRPAQPSKGTSFPVSVSIYDRTRVENWQWFVAPPQSATYCYAESLLRIGVAQSIGHIDWQLELSQPSVLLAPDDAVSPVTAQGQMGLGATYYAANGNSRSSAAAFFKQGSILYRFGLSRGAISS